MTILSTNAEYPRAVQSSLVDHRVSLDLYTHFRADQGTHLYHSTRRADLGEYLAVCPSHLFGVTDVSDVYDRAHHILDPRAGLLQRAADRPEDILRLDIGIAGQRVAPRGSSGNMHVRPDALNSTVFPGGCWFASRG